jgi:ribosome-associated translation inhibitor RaiA
MFYERHEDIISMKELDFAIELNSESLSDRVENELFIESEDRLLELASGHDDLTGAAINVRRPAKAETAYIYEVTVAVYARPNQIAATEKDGDPMVALKHALSAVERQVREKRAKLGKRWERPGNDPVTQEVIAVEAAQKKKDLGS